MSLLWKSHSVQQNNKMLLVLRMIRAPHTRARSLASMKCDLDLEEREMTCDLFDMSDFEIQDGHPKINRVLSLTIVVECT